MQQGVIGRQHGVNSHAGEDNPHRVNAALPCKGINQSTSKGSTAKGKQRYRVGQAGKQKQNGGCRRACAGRYADGAGIRQRIAHNGLQQCPGGGQRGSDHNGQQKPRQAQVDNNHFDGTVFSRKDGVQDFANAVSCTAYCDCHHRQHGQENQQNQPDRSHTKGTDLPFGGLFLHGYSSYSAKCANTRSARLLMLSITLMPALET